MLKRIMGIDDDTHFVDILTYILVFLIPFQLYFKLYQNLSLSVAQIIVGVLFILSFNKIRINVFSNLFQSRQSKSILKLNICIISFLIIMFVSIFVSDDKVNSIKYFTKWASFIMVYFIVLYNIRTQNKIGKCLLIVLYSMALVSCIGIFEYISGYDKVFNWFSTNPLATIIMEPETIRYKMLNRDTNWVTWLDGGQCGIRAFGTFESVLVFAAYIGMILPFFLWLFNCNYINIVFIGLIASTLILTFTRIAYFALFLTLAINLAVIIKYTVIYHKRYYIFGIIFLIILTTSLIFGNKSIKDSFASRFSTHINLQFERGDLWLQGIKIFKVHPCLGVGIANYRNGLIKYANKDAQLIPSHNQYIQIAAEMGIVGLSVYLTILFFGMKYSYEIIKKASDLQIKLLGLGFMGAWIWYSIQSFFAVYLFDDKFSMMFWLMAGLNASLYNIYKDENKIVLVISQNEIL